MEPIPEKEHHSLLGRGIPGSEDPGGSIYNKEYLEDEKLSSSGSRYGTLSQQRMKSSPVQPGQHGREYDLLIEKPTAPRRYCHEIILALVCCLEALSSGFILGFTSPTVPQLREQGALNGDQVAWYEAIAALGAMLGGITICFCVQFCRRKTAVFLTLIPLTLGWFSLVLAWSYVLLYVGRFLTGLAGGMLAIACGLYMSESVSDNIRGAILMSFQLFVGIGITIIYALGLILDTQWLAMVSMIPTAIMVVALLFLPDSPRWLLKKGCHMEAFDALMWLRQDTAENVRKELEKMEFHIQQHDNNTNTTLIKEDISRLWRPMCICMMLFIFQQFCGIGVVLLNTQDIFAMAGFRGSSETAAGAKQAIIVGIVKVFSLFVTTFVIDRFGRRPLYLVSGACLMVSSVFLGLYFYFQESLGDSYAWIALVSLIVYMLSYAVGFGPVPWITMAEIIPSQFRGWAPGCSSSISWLSAFVILKVFQDIVDAIAWSGLFWVFAGICALGSIFAFFVMPETKMKSLENIEHDEFSISVHN